MRLEFELAYHNSTDQRFNHYTSSTPPLLEKQNELISDVLQWTPTRGRASVGRPARTYLQQHCADTGCSLEDLPAAIDDRDRWRMGERERERERLKFVLAAHVDYADYDEICSDNVTKIDDVGEISNDTLKIMSFSHLFIHLYIIIRRYES